MRLSRTRGRGIPRLNADMCGAYLGYLGETIRQFAPFQRLVRKTDRGKRPTSLSEDDQAAGRLSFGRGPPSWLGTGLPRGNRAFLLPAVRRFRGGGCRTGHPKAISTVPMRFQRFSAPHHRDAARVRRSGVDARSRCSGAACVTAMVCARRPESTGHLDVEDLPRPRSRNCRAGSKLGPNGPHPRRTDRKTGTANGADPKVNSWWALQDLEPLRTPAV